MIKLTPQQKTLFASWIQEQADYLAIKIDNHREILKTTGDKSVTKDILCYSAAVNSLITTKTILLEGDEK